MYYLIVQSFIAPQVFQFKSQDEAREKAKKLIAAGHQVVIAQEVPMNVKVHVEIEM